MSEINPGPGRFEGNSVHDNAYVGIYVAESRRISVLDNTLVNNRLQLRDIEGRECATREVAVAPSILADV